MRLVDGAAALVVALRLARVDPVPVDAPLEEPGAAVAGEDAVVFAGAGVATHAADQPRAQPALDSRLVTQQSQHQVLHEPFF